MCARIGEFFNAVHAEADKHVAVFDELGVPIFRIVGYDSWYEDRKLPLVYTNCNLKALRFYKVMPTFEAHQALSMWLGAQAAPDKPIPDVPDKIMVGAKGFTKYSFRKDPQTKKKRK